MIDSNDGSVSIEAQELLNLAQRAFAAVGVPKDQAAQAADILWTGEMMGISTHGLRRIITYVQRIHDGAINPAPAITVDRKAPSLALIDGDDGLGPVVGSVGVAEAITMANDTGIGYAACRRSHHFGPVAPYALRAVNDGFVAFMGTNAQPVMAPWQGKQLGHGNNPIAVAAPRRNGPPFILDIAQSIVAYSKLRHAHEAGEEIPAGWASDSDGNPTIDPQAGLSGWVMPIGEHKGYGLALAVELFAAALSGGAIVSEVNSLYRRDDQAQGVCHFFLVIDPHRLIGKEQFLDRVEMMCSLMKGTPAIDATKPVLIPGEPEAERMTFHAAHGISMPKSRYIELQAMARGELPQSMPDK